MTTATFTAARNIQTTLGTRVAAGYLRNRGVSLRVALHWLIERSN